ncbi:MAG: hypothetical protein NTV68_05475 [Methanomicrobiales archaeon]|nr:hypothetical protein [Methanomicrobiales archaeon]
MTAVTAETNAATDLNKPSITVSVSPSTPKVGDTVVISGLAKGGNLTPGISMWIFAGNYVNITNVPVNGTGFYSKSVNTAEFPPAYYYIFIQHPGSDSRFNINPRGYSGEVVNTNTGAVIFNFTGTGSVNDNAAAIALSTAFNTVGVDDVFSKTGVQLLPAVSGATVSTPTHNGIQATIAVATTSQTRESKPLSTVAATALPTNSLAPGAALTTAIPATTKAPLSIISFVLGIGIVVTGIVLRRKN